MNVRHLKSAWLAFGLIPFAAGLVGQWDFAAGSFIAYAVGWWLLWRAAVGDPEGDIIKGLWISPNSRIAAGMGLVMLLLLLLASPKVGFGGLFAVALLVFSSWAAADSTRNLKLRLARITMMFVTLAICITTAELGLRLLQFKQPKDGGGWTWGHQVRTNGLGFREREVVSPKPKGAFRVMVLGDSLTWGVGLADEQRFTNLVETQLGGSYSRQDIEVLNFGLMAAPTAAESEILNQHIDLVDPDLVVVGFCVNDPQPKSQSYAVELDRFRPLFKIYRFLGKHLGATQLANFLHVRTDNVLRNSGFVPGHQESLDRCYSADSVEWLAFESSLDSIHRTCKARHLPRPVFMALLQGNGDFNKPNERLRFMLKWNRQANKSAVTAGFTVVDLETDFKNEGARDRQVNSWDGHPDAECNVVYAANLAPIIARYFDEHQLASKEMARR